MLTAIRKTREGSSVECFLLCGSAMSGTSTEENTAPRRVVPTTGTPRTRVRFKKCNVGSFLTPETVYTYSMENETTMPNDETMDKIAELAADTLRERIMEEYGDLIHDSIGDAVLEVLGEDFVNNLVEDSEKTYSNILMDLTSRIAIVAA